MTDVLLIGEAMGLFIANDYGDFEEVTHFTKGVAGAELNVAIGLSRLGFDVSYFTKLGQDPIGRYIKQFINSENVNTQYVIKDTVNNTGLQIKNKVTKDDPAVHSYRKNSAFTTLSKSELADVDFSDIRLLHITGIPLAINETTREVIYEFAKRAKEANCMITFDPNIRPDLWDSEELMSEVINDIVKYADVFMPGISEADLLTGHSNPEEIATFYQNLGVDTVIIKDGSNGAYFKEKTNDLELVRGIKVEKVVDTVGAGDGFSAGVISGLLENLTVVNCVQRGNVIGSIQVQHQSDNEGLPTREELLSYKKQENN